MNCDCTVVPQQSQTASVSWDSNRKCSILVTGPAALASDYPSIESPTDLHRPPETGVVAARLSRGFGSVTRIVPIPGRGSESSR